MAWYAVGAHCIVFVVEKNLAHFAMNSVWFAVGDKAMPGMD